MIEHNIVKALLDRQRYETYRKYVSFVDREFQQIMLALDSWWIKHEVEPTIDDLELHFKTVTPNLTEKRYALYKGIFQAIRESSGKEGIEAYLDQSKRKASLIDLASKALEAAENPQADQLVELTSILSSVCSEDSKEQKPLGEAFVSDDLLSLKESAVAKAGLRWRLPSLNQSLGSLRKGDFGFIFARPETGKTTFLASEASFMAVQSKSPILWFNNEEQGDKVMIRNYQAYFGVTIQELFSKPEYYRDKYNEEVAGRIKMLDAAHIHKTTVTRLCEQHKPSLIIFDQIDKIKGFDADRKDLQLGEVYQWARELAKTYAPVIGVCQSDGSGEGQKWLTMANVADAKTSKQAEADWIVGIGKTFDIEMQHLRYLNISKNKLMGDADSVPELRHGRFEVIIQPEIGRYGEVE